MSSYLCWGININGKQEKINVIGRDWSLSQGVAEGIQSGTVVLLKNGD